MSAALWLAVGLALAGVIASFVPLVPGGLLSLAGVVSYWYLTGDLSTAALAGLGGLCVAIVLFDWLGSAVAAHASGAAAGTAVLAAVAAAVLLFLVGPVGAVLGVATVVFLAEYRRHGDTRRGLRTAAFTTVGMLASTAVQFVLTATVLVSFLLVVLL